MNLIADKFTIAHCTAYYIAAQAQLDEAVAYLATCTELALDLEFDRNRYRYGFNLCLLQIEANNRVYIIDPISADLKSFDGLWQIFENPAILKIMHSPNEDISLLKIKGCNPRNLVDTESAARLQNIKTVSLGALLELFLEVKLDKDQQTSNWNHRPLSLSQLMYAAYDVVYLRQLYYKIIETMPIEHRAWHAELCTELEATSYEPDPDAYRKMLDWRTASETDYYIAKTLYDWRDNLAKQLNTPPASVISNALLVEWANTPLEGYQQWLAIKGLPHKLRNEYYYNQYKKNLDKARHETVELGLKTVWTRPPQHKYVRTREDAEYLKETLKNFRGFLREKYGESLAALLLSSTQCEAIVGGKTFSDIRRFAEQPVREAAILFGIDVEKYAL